MEGEGSLTIRTSLHKDQNHITIEFSDTGPGIEPENLKRLFEPFFSTKEVGKGTGLGLSISYSIIQKHNGTIDVHSQTGKGSTFTVILPTLKSAKNE